MLGLTDFPSLAITVAGFIGLLVGSFLNVVIYRLPRMLQFAWERDCAELRGESPPTQEKFNLATPRSRCGSCAHPIPALHNIPVLSFLLLRGKCAACGGAISWRYPLVELSSGLASAYCVFTFGATAHALAAIGLVWCLLVLALIDWDTQFLPDNLTLPLLWLGLLVNLVGAPWAFTTLEAAVLGAMAGYLSLWTVYWLFKLVTGKEGMGFGDFKLLAALGAWFGWQALPLLILLSSISGAVIGMLWLAWHKQGRDHPIPFGPFLAAAGGLMLFFGADLQAIMAVFLPGFGTAGY